MSVNYQWSVSWFTAIQLRVNQLGVRVNKSRLNQLKDYQSRGKNSSVNQLKVQELAVNRN